MWEKTTITYDNDNENSRKLICPFCKQKFDVIESVDELVTVLALVP
jgi:hypothetical protein